MKEFIVYDKSDGKIIRSGYCPDGLLADQGNAEQPVMEYSRTDETHVINGIPVRIDPVAPPPPTPEEIAAAEELAFLQEALAKVAKAFFNHENRLRALEGKASITWEQFKTAIRGMS